MGWSPAKSSPSVQKGRGLQKTSRTPPPPPQVVRQGRWVRDWAVILRASTCGHRMSEVGVFKDHLSTSMPGPGPHPTPPLKRPALCLSLLLEGHQCSDPTPAACSQIKGFPSPTCALWFLGVEGKLHGREAPDLSKGQHVWPLSKEQRGVSISGAAPWEHRGHGTDPS